ncbi:MAG TPA: LysM peptidoglycan-binding domain-containing protein [Phycisphaerae bacterium]|nr:LysM peptidoglycan-binding domain-containing protein [Phycisphaerae bacterium]
MRSDAKIGMLIGAVLIAVAGWYFLGQDKQGQPIGLDQELPTADNVTPAADAPEPRRPALVAAEPNQPVAMEVGPIIPLPVGQVGAAPEPTQQAVATPSAAPQEPTLVPVEPEPSWAGAHRETVRTTELRVQPAPRAKPLPVTRTHVIQTGDTFADLAERYYGSRTARYVSLMMQANPDVDPRRMRVGTEVVIPSPESDASAEAAPAKRPAVSASAGTYRAQEGDTLYAIARKLCGNGERYRELHALNRDLIGGDANRLRPGMVLRVPSDWSASNR